MKDSRHLSALRLSSIVALLASSLSVGVPLLPAQAHPGGLNAEGCHTNRKTGEYHCHRGSASAARAPRPLRAAPMGGTFRNCSQARAAGVAPIRAGQPGYSRKLDRDGDGIACE
jgi:hypothetical protein